MFCIISPRLLSLEEQSHEADEKLAAARKDLQELANMGLVVNELGAFVARVKAVAQRHEVPANALRERLLQELEKLDRGLGLEALVTAAREELADQKKALAEAEREWAATQASVERLRKEQATLRATIKEGELHLCREIRAIGKVLNEEGEQLRRTLADGIAQSLSEVGKLRNQTLAVGREIGGLENEVQASRWLRGLMSLVRGDEEVSLDQVRVVGLAVLRPISAWLHVNSEASPPALLPLQLRSVIEHLEQWRT